MPRRVRYALYAVVVLALTAYLGVQAWDRWGPSTQADAPVNDGLEEFLAPWYEAVQGQADRPATVVVVGDSISEGILLPSPVFENRMVARLQEKLREAQGIDGGTGFMPPYYGDATTPDDTVRTGTPAQEQMFQTWGLGGRALLMPAGAEVTYPQQEATRVRVWYGRTAVLGGQAKVFVDGKDVTAQGTLSTGEPSGETLSSAGTSSEAGLWWSSPELSGAEHVVQVRSVAAGFSFVHTGVDFFDGDAESGIHVVDASHSGVAAAHYASPNAVQGHWTEVAAHDPDLILVNIGSNPEPDHATSLRTLVENALAAAPRARILIVDGYEPGTWTPERWQEIRDARRAVAEARPDRVAVFDLARHWPALAKDGTTNDGLMIENAMPLHPNVKGNERMAEIYAELLTPPED